MLYDQRQTQDEIVSKGEHVLTKLIGICVIIAVALVLSIIVP